MSKKVLFIKNIIPPYRISLFNSLQKHIDFESNGFEFTVFVCDRNEKGRSWILSESDLDFNFIIDDTGFYKNILNKYHFRFNPKLFSYIFKNKNVHIVAGSSWNDPNIVLLSFLKRLKIIPNKLSFWTEANYHTIHQRKNKKHHNKGVLSVIRNFVLNSSDSKFLIPGKIAEETLFCKWNIKNKGVIFFPNLISHKFQLKEVKNIVIQNNNIKYILIVARHIEGHKGILNFLKSLTYESDYIIWLAGDGPDSPKYKEYIKSKGLEKRVLFLGDLKEESLNEYYLKASIFVLPSFYDQSPLAIVEAAFLGLPLFVSERCGNHVELVENGINGYTFDPDNYTQIRTLFNKLMELPDVELIKMGKNSLKIALENYDSKTIFKNLIDNI